MKKALCLCGFFALISIALILSVQSSFAEDYAMVRGESKEFETSYTQYGGYWTVDDSTVVMMTNSSFSIVVTEAGSSLVYKIELTALKTGTTVLRFRNSSGTEIVSSAVAVTSPITSFTLSKANHIAALSSEYSLGVTIVPDDADALSVTWESSDPAVVSVDSSGHIVAGAIGSATITVFSSDGIHSAQCAVQVVRPTENIEVTHSSLELTSRTQPKQIEAAVYPADATITQMEYESSNTDVATVDSSGLVTAHHNGNATITIKAKDGFSSAQVSVLVSRLAESVTLDQTALEFTRAGQTGQLSAGVLPADALQQAVSWVSTNESVATVGADGMVTAVAPGTADVYAYHADGIQSEVCAVRVWPIHALSFRTWDSDSGTTIELLPQAAVEHGGTYTLQKPQRSGWVFVSWYLGFNNGTYSNPVSGSITVTNDMVVYAEFNPFRSVGPVLTDYEFLYGQDNTYFEIKGLFNPDVTESTKYTIHSSDLSIAAPDPRFTQEPYIGFFQNGKPIIYFEMIVYRPGTVSFTAELESGEQSNTMTVTIAQDEGDYHLYVLHPTVPEITANAKPTMEIEISYSAYPGATSYEIRGYDNDGRWVYSNTVDNLSAGSCLHRDLNGNIESGDTYTYKMRVHYGPVDKSEWSAPVSVTVPYPTFPASPVITVKPISLYEVEVNYPYCEGASYYEISVIASWEEVLSVTRISDVQAGKLTVTGLTPGMQYGFLMKAYYDVIPYSHDPYSSYSGRIWTFMPSLVVPPVIAAFPGAAGEVIINYPYYADALEYEYFAYDSFGNAVWSTKITDIPEQGGTIHNTGLTPGMTYIYKMLSAFQTQGITQTVWSEPVSVTIPYNFPPTPPPPPVITVKPISLYEAVVNYPYCDGAAYYEICVVTYPENTTSVIRISDIWAGSCTLFDLKPGKPYEIRMLVYYNAPPYGETPYVAASNTVSFSMPALAQPPEIQAYAGSWNRVIVTYPYCQYALGLEIFAYDSFGNAVWSTSITNLTISGSAIQNTGLKPGKTYTYKLFAIIQKDGITQTVWSEPKSVTMPYPSVLITKLKMSSTKADVFIGASKQLNVKITPVNAERDITWTSSNAAVAQVDANGLVTAKAAGAATISASTSTGVTAACNITVKPVLVSRIGMSTKNQSVQIAQGETLGKQIRLSALVTPANATNSSIVWGTSNGSVATVDQNGLVTCVGYGKATITAMASDGSKKKATCAVTVSLIKVARLTLNAKKQTIFIADGNPWGKQVVLFASIAPANATNGTVTWSSSNPGVAVVDQSGVVTSVGFGRTTITAMANDGSKKKATCTITVNPAAVR